MACTNRPAPPPARNRPRRGWVRHVAAAVAAAALALPAAAEDTALLIQLQPDGHYRVWHAGGPASLSEDEVLALEASAMPEGGRQIVTSAGLARAFDTGTVRPTEEELTELVLTALPEGGKRVSVGRLHAKAYSTKFGVIAVIWKPNPRRADPPPAR